MKLRLITLSLLSAAGLAVALPASAMHHEKFEAAFKSADKDGDGTLDKEEAKAIPKVARNFDALDTDKDGTLSMAEVMAGAKDKMKGKGKDMRDKTKAMHEDGKARFAAADKDGDGTLDKEEAKAMPRVAGNFDKIDADKDGTVSMDEIHAFMKSQHQGKRKDKDHDHDSHHGDGKED